MERNKLELKGAFHIHTSYSFDSFLSYKKVVKYGIKNKFDFLMITDHNTIEGAKKAKAFKEEKYPDEKLDIIIGAEYSTDKGDIIGLFLQDEIKSVKSLEVIKEIKQLGGIVVLPHPFKNHKLNEELIKKVDIIEVYNPRTSNEANKKAEELAKKYKKPTLVGSDAHFYDELNSAICIFECDDNYDLKKIFLYNRRKFITTKNGEYYEILSQFIRAYKLRNLSILISAFKNLYKKKIKNKNIQNWLVYKIADKVLDEAIQKYARGKLLDIGCGGKPYENMTKSYVTEHIGLDHENTLHDESKIDLFGTAYNIPIQKEYFDTVLCTAVLEHLEEPNRAIKETNRILKKGGYAVYTVPLFWHLHEEPRDFYRYTKHGLRYLFEKNGFEIVELKPLSGFWVTFGQELVYYLYRFRKGGKLNPLWWIIPLIGLSIQGICYLLSKIDHSEEFTWMYLAVVRKKNGTNR